MRTDSRHRGEGVGERERRTEGGEEEGEREEGLNRRTKSNSERKDASS